MTFKLIFSYLGSPASGWNCGHSWSRHCPHQLKVKIQVHLRRDGDYFFSNIILFGWNTWIFNKKEVQSGTFATKRIQIYNEDLYPVIHWKGLVQTSRRHLISLTIPFSHITAYKSLVNCIRLPRKVAKVSKTYMLTFVLLFRGEKQRMHLRDGFLADQLDPIYVAYNL